MGRRKKVLVVDMPGYTRRTIVECLWQCGYEVTAANTLEHAEEFLNKIPQDVVVVEGSVDPHSYGDDGFEWAEKPHGGAQIIVFSATKYEPKGCNVHWVDKSGGCKALKVLIKRLLANQ